MPVDQRDKEWFCSNIERHKLSFFRYARSILKNDEDAKDAVSEAVVAAYSKIDTLRDPERFKPWLMRIVTNEAYTMLRERARLAVSARDEPVDDRATIKSDNRLTLWPAVGRLSDELRAVVVLFYYEDMSIKEISAVTGITQSAVKTRLSRARQKLKLLLS
jgi:RNA polymerase sigma-70 factor (ECF subfamily)